MNPVDYLHKSNSALLWAALYRAALHTTDECSAKALCPR